MRSILIFYLVSRCLETIDGTYLFYVCCSDSVGVCGNVCCVTAIVKDSVFSLGVFEYVVYLCKVCDGCCVWMFVL